MAPIYKKVLIVGATSGIGWGIASALVKQGTHVIVVGRRVDKLEEFWKEHGGTDDSWSIQSEHFDATELREIPSFATKIIERNPDLDCVILNSGIQRPFDFTNSNGLSSDDLQTLDTEMTTNYTSYVHLTAAFMPFLLKSKTPTNLIYISATLGLVPGLLRTLNYNASKSALHTFILNLREQLNGSKEDGKNANVPKIIEIFPPAVQTELHDEKHQPDLVNGGQIGIPLDTFIEAMMGALGGDEVPDEFTVGNDGKVGEVMPFEKERQKAMKGMAAFLKGDAGLRKFLKSEQKA
ncbi:putative oxido DltE [Cyphellophora attinorum]|uniref:Putative oxido DltE n=1 Tax=Cyphellophora attinorum TaxID=1664694 RepID=A0A0N0NJD6_9EURO|nr:putative oxido DltE [Phialophora attinorum]KPI36499.1 putative oxido DltE [Phialophora attinorum]